LAFTNVYLAKCAAYGDRKVLNVQSVKSMWPECPTVSWRGMFCSHYFTKADTEALLS